MFGGARGGFGRGPGGWQPHPLFPLVACLVIAVLFVLLVIWW